MTLSYLVSTAGHAQYQNEQHPHDVRTILQLIDEGAEEMGDEKVVGFTSVSDQGEWKCDLLSYPELMSRSTAVAHGLVEAGVPVNQSGEEKIISLLCPTGLDFLLTWIAGMRLGYGVVFVAPQCSPSAILHLYQSTSSTHLIHHPKYAQLAQAVLEANPKTQLVALPEVSNSSSHDKLPTLQLNPANVSHVFHTSGTSGTPKPIPNTHMGSMSVLPRRAIPSYLPTSNTHHNSTSPSGDTSLAPSESAAFTTTPLFHGGVSDLLRAWMARSMIYFYPTSDVSITTQNVVAAVDSCQNSPDPLDGINPKVKERIDRFSVTAFLSVPYILSVLAEDLQGPGIAMLRGMRFVSTGGAPLDTAIGDAMVKEGVRLVSRLGSSECGFLLSSHRDYGTEKDWELLRDDSPYGDALVFEPQADRSTAGTERFEMIVTDRWLSKTKTNRDDGSYATGDLYEKHPTKTDVWRYVGRGDDVIVMSNGEKASPGPIESTLRSSPYLSDALVVGSDRPQLGVLLFPSSPPGPSDLLDLLQSVIAKANNNSPSFAQIAPEMCTIITDPVLISRLPKSSKGTIQRGVANDVYREEIERLYNGTGGSSGKDKKKRSLKEIETFVGDLVRKVAGDKSAKSTLEGTTDLFSWGVDSLMATRIRTALQKELIVGEKPLPGNVVFEHPTIIKLSKYMHDRQEGIEETSDTTEGMYRLMQELAERYGDFSQSSSSPSPSTLTKPTESGPAKFSKSGGITVLMTGATGSLGAFLLHQLVSLPPNVVERVVCFVRAENHEDAHRRVTRVLEKRGLNVSNAEGRFTALAAEVSQDRLGLDAMRYRELVGSVDVVIHAAWPVHFASSLVSFEDQIRGTRNLINLIRDTKRPYTRFFFCSSIASILGGSSTPKIVKEEWSNDPATASPIGYSQSKWVTESICHRAIRSPESGLEGRVHVLRIGQLCGDTITRPGGGYWNEKEGWPLLLRTAETTGSLPLLSERPSWLPVDLASRAILDIVLDNSASEPIYHIVHPKLVDWSIVLDGISNSGIQFERTLPKEWLRRVKASLGEDHGEDPSGQMLPMWESAYCQDIPSGSKTGQESESESTSAEPTVDSTKAQKVSETLKTAPAIDMEMIGRMINAWRQTGFLTS